jgi:membrane-bound serine protease (ClpP class)
MIGLLGLYIELNAPGVGLPGLVAVICFAVLFGSRFLVDLANWVETAIFAIGVILLLIEIFIIPGFGITGVAGTVCIMVGLIGILIKNKPGELPIPRDAVDWYYLRTGAFGLALGFLGFLVMAWILAKFLPRFEMFRPLMLSPYKPDDSGQSGIVMTIPANVLQKKIEVGDIGKVVKKLRPAGTARFEHAVVDVVSDGEFLDVDTIVEIITINGNRVVVRQAKSQEQNR